jgi:hypothetical protein
MRTQIWTLDAEGLSDNMNRAKNVFAEFLLHKGVINEEQFKDYLVNYSILVKKPRVFSSIWRKLLGKKAEDYSIILVKNMNLVPSGETTTSEGGGGRVLTLVRNNEEEK